MDLSASAAMLVAVAIAVIVVTFYLWKRRGIPPGPPEAIPLTEKHLLEFEFELSESKDEEQPMHGRDRDSFSTHRLLLAPAGLPFLAVNPFSSADPRRDCQDMGKRYGNVFSFYVGAQLTVVLNDYKAIRAAFVDQGRIFSGRPEGFLFRKQFEGDDGKGHGIAFHEGEIHKASRKFLLQALRDLETRNSKFERDVLVETDYLGDHFAKHEGAPFKPRRAIHNAVSSIICTLMFGERSDHSDPQLNQYLADIEYAFEAGNEAGPMQYYPFMRHLPGHHKDKYEVKKVDEAAKRARKYLRDKIAERREAYTMSRRARRSSETKPQDYIDVFLYEQRNQQAAGTVHPAFDDTELLQNLPLFFVAGTTTTVTSLEWIFLFVLHNPDVQAKIHQELNENIEHDNFVGIEDRGKLRYLEAVIREAQRLGTVVPFGITRSNLEETRLMGYRIPKRTAIVPNYAAVHVDPRLWEDPTAFRPERFLDTEGQLLEPPHFIPFSAGMRSCIGESAARMMLFMIFANIMQRFEIHRSDLTPLPGPGESTRGLLARPLDFDMEVNVRFNPVRKGSNSEDPTLTIAM